MECCHGYNLHYNLTGPEVTYGKDFPHTRKGERVLPRGRGSVLVGMILMGKVLTARDHQNR